MAGASTWIKYFMFIYNFLLWLCGMLILSLIMWLIRDKDVKEILSYEDTVHPYSALKILVVVSTVITVLAFVGCCGAANENRVALFAFFLGLLVVLILLVIQGTAGIISKSKIENYLMVTFNDSVKLLNSTTEAAKIFQEALMAFQGKFKCCGLINGPVDWGNNFENFSISCKCAAAEGYSCTTYDGKQVYEQPCAPFIKREIQEHIKTLIGITFGIALIEVFGLLFSLMLLIQLGKK